VSFATLAVTQDVADRRIDIPTVDFFVLIAIFSRISVIVLSGFYHCILYCNNVYDINLTQFISDCLNVVILVKVIPTMKLCHSMSRQTPIFCHSSIIATDTEDSN